MGAFFVLPLTLTLLVPYSGHKAKLALFA